MRQLIAQKIKIFLLRCGCDPHRHPLGVMPHLLGLHGQHGIGPTPSPEARARARACVCVCVSAGVCVPTTEAVTHTETCGEDNHFTTRTQIQGGKPSFHEGFDTRCGSTHERVDEEWDGTTLRRLHTTPAPSEAINTIVLGCVCVATYGCTYANDCERTISSIIRSNARL